MIDLRFLRTYAGDAHPGAAPGCELCGATLAADHRHVVEIGRRGHDGVRCACRPCAILFASGARFRTVPTRVLRGGPLPVERWALLGLPVELAVFVRDSVHGRAAAWYPGPAGIVDAELAAPAWAAIEAATPLARQLADDVEALLVHRPRGAPDLACYLVPISTAYELAGRLRMSWRGFTGGDDAQRELREFFAALARRGAAA